MDDEPVAEKTTLEEDSRHWERIPAENDIPTYYIYTERVQRSYMDGRRYAVIRLDNHLEATVVNDVHASTSAACMSIAAGRFNDPEDMAGAAHACEHLLFMGSRKYPEENAFDKYCDLNSGYNGAGTGPSDTEFYFQVASDALAGALNYFSAFFYCPLFHEDSVLHEIKVIDSEYSGGLQDDSRRLEYVENSLAHPAHPLRRLGTGNKDTLLGQFLALRAHDKSVKDKTGHLSRSPSEKSGNSHRSTEPSRTQSRSNVQVGDGDALKVAALKSKEKLIRWWEKEYCAGRMRLVVVGTEPLAKLISMVVKNFSPIKNRGQNPAPKIVYVKTIEKAYKIIIAFPIAWQAALWREKPAWFLVHLLGHEGPGSLHAYLQKKGWLLSLVAGVVNRGRGISLLQMYLQLTKDGFENHREVIVACFKFINLLHKSKFPEWMWKELELCEKLSFCFHGDAGSLSLARRMAELMAYPTPRALLIREPVLFWEWNEDLVKETSKNLDIENCYIIVAAQNHDQIPKGATWCKERWYGTEHIEKRFDTKLISEARKDNDITYFALPERNPFLPQHPHIYGVPVDKPKKRPALLRRTPLMEVWHKRNDRFWTPDAIVHIAARTPVAGATTRARILTQMFVDLVKDAFHEHGYFAKVADLDYKLFDATRGFEIQIDGYSDKLLILAHRILDKFKPFEIRKDRLEVMIKQGRRALKSDRLGKPFELSSSYLYYLIQDDCLSTEERSEALKNITVEELSKHVKALLSMLKLVILTNGNLRKKDVFELASLVEKTFEPGTIPENEVPKLRSRLLPKGCSFVWDLPVPNPKEANSSVSYYCHVGNKSDTHTYVTCCLLSKILAEPAFDFLRTKEQLGYTVFASALADIESIGWCLVIESEIDSRYVESRIDAFLMYMRRIIRDMTDKMFKNHKRSLQKIWTERDGGMARETDRFWGTIQDGYYAFKKLEKDAKLLPSISLDEVYSMFKTCLDPSSTTRSKLSIHMRSQLPPKAPENPPPPNVSRHASQKFLELLHKEHIIVSRDEYNWQCEVEPTLPEMHEYLKKTCFSEMLNSNHRKVKDLFRQLKSLVKNYPAEPALKSTQIKDGTKFKHSLALSGFATPVQTFEVEHQ
ncbi:uncharacterized protein FOMMEDRAFT_94516 [Fomitiporia mediterranea MF3/22]|uniref:uncharacterized protein n=1 Tax=Fomitiporia mediterranea (strain MF3/22) TaxID=694068 RepID=UPI00044099A1|nr:uncharacterized protein FOMMEDRAFT_94516 [Fomitiporia mediterranea MF3/22]EJC99289.1 hypothetical protein FOMMEDRAFT_94516 [Fomitiporia mediterranea MF3/22]